MGTHKCEGDRVNSHKPLIICSRSSKGFGGACGWGFGFSSFAPAPPSSSSSPSSMRSGSACPRLYNRRHEGHMRLVRRLLLYQSICKGGSKLLAHYTASLVHPLSCPSPRHQSPTLLPKPNTPLTSAISSGSTILSISSTSPCANSAHSGSSKAGACAKKGESTKARASRTRGPLPGS